MNLAKVVMLATGVFLMAARAVPAQTTTTQEVTTLLREFMDAAGRNDRAVFEKFFADDVIYTRATGVVINKANIMESLSMPDPTPKDKTAYSAEDITIHEYGDTVVVAFRLVGRTAHRDGKVETADYRNTGTFLKRNGRWQAVAWQATKISEPKAQ